MATRVRFTKMHGLGNDFMVIDAINQLFIPDTELIKLWANRHTGVGFDQLLLVEHSQRADCDFKYRIFNCDGGEVEQCGNGARCFAKYVIEKGLTDKQEIRVETKKEVLILTVQDDDLIKVNMNQPKFTFSEIPFIPKNKDNNDPVQIVSIGALALPVTCVNVGNPHAVIMVDDVEKAPVTVWGKGVESSEQFPEKTNVGFMQVIDREHIKLRVYERGTGETLACGSGACAAVVVGISLGVLDNKVVVTLPGGDLEIAWEEGNDITMIGSVAFVFDGVINSA
ncbi:MAG: diaminopimelate epimerase [Neisseriaceae bacterium]|nr:MAG: diaminopimelate epimerase [Neisseriaceae bacterium]